jgi:hydroxyproline transporter system substrate-binding protein
MQKLLAVTGLAALLAFGWQSGPAQADKLDDVIASGQLRCGMMLDFPPLGFRDANNEPAGFDVDYCNDMAAALGVDAMVVETPSPQRIPALVSGQTDIGFGGMTATPERAKTVLFSNTYIVFKAAVAVKKGSDIKKWDDLQGKTVATVRGTTPEIEYLKHCVKWPGGCKYQSYASNGDQVLAFNQGKADAMIEANAFFAELLKTDKGKDMEICCYVPGFTDWASIGVNRGDFGFRDWVNLFVFTQVDKGRYAELFTKWFGSEPPRLMRDDVSF